MFPEGQGKPNAKAKLAAVVPMINELFVQSREVSSARDSGCVCVRVAMCTTCARPLCG